jgi:hypothetical protein
MEDLFAASFRTSGLTSAGFRQLIRGLQRAFGNEKVVLVEWSENRKLSRNGLVGSANEGFELSTTRKYGRPTQQTRKTRFAFPQA